MEPSLEEFDPELNVRIVQYNQLREEIRSFSARRDRRVIGGFSAVGIILGYSFIDQGDPRVIVVLPLVLAFLFFIQIEDSGWVARAASELCRIERRVPVDEFRFSSHHGILSSGPNSKSRKLALANIFFLLGLVYLLSSVAAVMVILDQPAESIPFKDIAPIVLAAIYTLMIPSMAYATRSYLREFNSLREEAFDSLD